MKRAIITKLEYGLQGKTLARYVILRFVDNEFCYEMLIRAGSLNAKDYTEYARYNICTPINRVNVNGAKQQAFERYIIACLQPSLLSKFQHLVSIVNSTPLLYFALMDR